MKKENLEHNSIKARQKEKSSDYSDANPSEVTEIYWIYAERKKGKYPKSTMNSGKWLIFVDKRDNDEVWKRLRKQQRMVC